MNMLNSYIGYRGGVFFMNGDYHIVRQKARAQPPHTHDFIEIVYIHSGRGTHIIDGVQYPVKHGDILFINSKSNHRAFSEREMIYTNILIKLETIDGSLRGNENAFSILSIHDFAKFEHALNKDNCHISFSGEERNLVESLINLMEAENGKTAPGSNLIVHSALNILLPLIFRKMSLPMKDAFGINAELLLYIKDNCSSNITLESIAHRCFYTPAYFSRAFKKFTGVTFTEYLTQCRIDKAKSFLTDTDMPIEAIIAEVGYSNRTKFFSAFKESTGTTPYRYKKSQI